MINRNKLIHIVTIPATIFFSSLAYQYIPLYLYGKESIFAINIPLVMTLMSVKDFVKVDKFCGVR